MKNIQAGRQAGRQAGDMTATSPIARAITELETEREHLVARLAKVDAAIATMRDLFHLPSTNGRPRAKTQSVAAGRVVKLDSTSKAGKFRAAILAALARGPMAPGDLAEKLGRDRAAVRYQVKHLEDAGEIVSTGTTANRQVALAGTPAKEAP
jgi:hypothetical protein